MKNTKCLVILSKAKYLVVLPGQQLYFIKNINIVEYSKTFKTKIKLLLIFVFSIVLISSCEKDEEIKEFPDIIKDKGVFIINEGNYNFGNASLGYIDKNSGKEYFKLFEQANNRSLGDVFQSISLINDLLFLVINNSGTIEIIDPVSIESIATITGLTSPREIIKVNENRALVSDLYSDKIAVIDLNDYSVINYINVSGWTEATLKFNERIFVSNMEKHLVYSVDPETLALTDSINTFAQPNSMQIDKNGNLQVLCAGNPEENEHGGIITINPETFELIGSLSFPDNLPPAVKLNINTSGSTLYFIAEDIWSVPVDEMSLPSNPFINAGNRNFYGLGIDPFNDNIFVADAIDYVQKAKILEYNPSGEHISTYDSGIIPGGFFFY